MKKEVTYLNALSSIGMSQSQPYFSQSQDMRVKNSASEEANESPAERAAEAGKNKTTKLDVYA